VVPAAVSDPVTEAGETGEGSAPDSGQAPAPVAGAASQVGEVGEIGEGGEGVSAPASVSGAGQLADSAQLQAPTSANALEFLQEMVDRNLNQHCVETTSLTKDEKRFLKKITDKAGGREDAEDHGTNTTSGEFLQWERIEAFFKSKAVTETTKNLLRLAVWLIVLKCCDWTGSEALSELQKEFVSDGAGAGHGHSLSLVFLLAFLNLQEGSDLITDEQKSQLIQKAKEEYGKSKKSYSELPEEGKVLEGRLLEFKLVKQSTDLAGPSQPAEDNRGTIRRLLDGALRLMNG
jgi:hypothetical protein